MGQKPILVRPKQPGASNQTAGNSQGMRVGEAARRLGVSERTIFRLLKEGQLERIDSVLVSDIDRKYDSHNFESASDANNDEIDKGRRGNNKERRMTDIMFASGSHVESDLLHEQVREKDAQIAHLVKTQQEMAQTIQRLQEQMFELAQLVLSHNAAAALAKAEAELKLQEQAQAASRRGLSAILSPRSRK